MLEIKKKKKTHTHTWNERKNTRSKKKKKPTHHSHERKTQGRKKGGSHDDMVLSTVGHDPTCTKKRQRHEDEVDGRKHQHSAG